MNPSEAADLQMTQAELTSLQLRSAEQGGEKKRRGENNKRCLFFSSLGKNKIHDSPQNLKIVFIEFFFKLKSY